MALKLKLFNKLMHCDVESSERCFSLWCVHNDAPRYTHRQREIRRESMSITSIFPHSRSFSMFSSA